MLFFASLSGLPKASRPGWMGAVGGDFCIFSRKIGASVRFAEPAICLGKTGCGILFSGQNYVKKHLFRVFEISFGFSAFCFGFVYFRIKIRLVSSTLERHELFRLKIPPKIFAKNVEKSGKSKKPHPVSTKRNMLFRSKILLKNLPSHPNGFAGLFIRR